MIDLPLIDNFAAVRDFDAANQVEQGALATAAATEQNRKFATDKVVIEAVYDDAVTTPFGELFIEIANRNDGYLL